MNDVMACAGTIDNHSLTTLRTAFESAREAKQPRAEARKMNKLTAIKDHDRALDSIKKRVLLAKPKIPTPARPTLAT